MCILSCVGTLDSPVGTLCYIFLYCSSDISKPLFWICSSWLYLLLFIRVHTLWACGDTFYGFSSLDFFYSFSMSFLLVYNPRFFERQPRWIHASVSFLEFHENSHILPFQQYTFQGVPRPVNWVVIQLGSGCKLHVAVHELCQSLLSFGLVTWTYYQWVIFQWQL